jgi:hypothetical protein
MDCQIFNTDRRTNADVQIDRYRWLHDDGKRLIKSWFDRAWKSRDCEPNDSFEPFIFTWISFNGWAACVTEKDSDRDWLKSLMSSIQLCQDYENIIKQDSYLSQCAHEFYDLWPIFKAQEIRRRGVQRCYEGNRNDVTNHYIKSNIRNYEPQCWKRHNDERSKVPLDWPHTLSAIYRVRCNLFHGEKFAHSEMDVSIVSSAFRVLVNFIKIANYID